MKLHCLLALLTVVLTTFSAQAIGLHSIFGSKPADGNKKLQTNDILSAHHDLDEQVRPRQAAAATVSAARLSPVILVPGDGGSRLEAKLDRKDVLHHYCERKSDDWFDLWVNLSLLVPFAIDCWVENMKLVYNSTTRRTQNAPGVITRVKGFARTESVEFVDPAKIYGTNYFDSLVHQLVEFGYERDKNIFGAPYDFRRAPNELGDYFANLEKLILKAYEQNGNERVVFICHSMGCPYALYYLNGKTQAWKDKYVRSIVSLAGVYAGSVKAMKAYASGDNFGVVVVPSLSLRKDVRTFPSLAFLMPSPEIFPKDQVLVRNRNISYSSADYRKFFQDIDYPNGYEMWLDVKDLASPLKAPGVEVHCLHGHKVNTPEMLDYEVGHFPDSKPKVNFGDGDGTVNLVSLTTCLKWRTKQREPIYYRNFSAVDHMTILSDSKVMDYLGEALSKKD